MSLVGALALPVAMVATGALSYLAKKASAHYTVATHNALLGRLTDGAGRVAGEINGALAKLPPGSDLQTVEQTLIAQGVRSLKNRFTETIDSLGVDDGLLASIITGELGKLTGSAAVTSATQSSIASQLVTALTPSTTTTTTDPVTGATTTTAAAPTIVETVASGMASAVENAVASKLGGLADTLLEKVSSAPAAPEPAPATTPTPTVNPPATPAT